MAAGLPISPNMDPTTINQTQTQVSFTRLIVQPLFESMFDLFPRTVSLMDLIVDNLRQWGGIDLPPVAKHRRGAEEKGRKKLAMLAAPSQKKSSEGGRRLSFAAGTVEIPEALQKLLTKSAKPTRKSLRKASHLDEDIDIEGLNIEEEEEEEVSPAFSLSPDFGAIKQTESAPDLTE